MVSERGALIVFGSGPGIGRNVAAMFAERGFEKVILMSRNESRLQEDSAFVTSKASGAKVEIVPVDLSDTGSLPNTLKEVDKRLDGVPLECVFYNAARLGPSKIMDWPAESLESDLKISVVSLYIVAQWAMPQLLQHTSSDNYSPSFLVTSGMLSKDPSPAVFSLAACKAAQYNFVHSLHKEYEPKGIHCALNVVGGRVADESKITNARNVAEEMWRLYSREGQGDVEVAMMDPDYLAHIKRREEANKN